MKHKTTGIITPEPFFKIAFGCSNRAFYQVKSDLYDIGENVGIEVQDGFIEEQCDYEGDLENIVIYNDERSSTLINGVLSFYGIPLADLPDGMNIELSIF